MGHEEQRAAATTGSHLDEERVIKMLRIRNALITARYSLVVGVLLSVSMIANYVINGDPNSLGIAGTWIVSMALWVWALLLLRRNQIAAGTNRILTGIALILVCSSFFDSGILALASYFLGFPVLQIAALGLASPGYLRRWSRAIPPAFIITVLSRQLMHPHPVLEDPLSLALVLLGGAVGLIMISHLSLGIVEARRRALAASEDSRHALEAANTELEVARDEALAASHAKSAFLATMSHELRTPLNAIIGYSELIGEEYEDLPLTADIERILGASHHLLELINGVLDLSKIEAGRMDLFFESIPVDALIRGVADAVRPTIEGNQSHLVLNLGRALGTIESDLTKVRQILLNLASNAAKFTSKGTVEIVAARSRNAEGESGLELSVRDTGIGIPKENLETIFTPFVQADPSTTRLFGGTGLGLAITRRFVKMLGGHMEVTSELGVGSCFSVWLPRRPPGSAASSREGSSAWQLAQLESDATTEPSGVSPGGSSSMSMAVGPIDGAHVLVIDESPEVHQYLRRLLVKEGFRVSVATSGAEGLALAHRDRPDLITIDVVKRSADSWEVLCELNNDHELARVPVQAISFGAAGPDKPPSGLHVADFFSIPVEPELLSELLGCYLDDASKAGGRRPRVLIVDDDARIRAGLHAALDRKRYRITEAHGGAEAIVALRAAHPPDIVILDLMMPVIDGFAVLDEITANQKIQGLPVLISLPRVLTIAELYILSERARTHIRRGRIDGEAALLKSLQRVRERAEMAPSGIERTPH